MRLSRFFVPTPLALGHNQLPESLAHYMVKVLRLSTNQSVQLFDGSGKEYMGIITEIAKKKVTVLLQQQIDGLQPSPLYTHLGQGLSRGERMDWVIQKATELGIDEITPLLTDYCEVRLNEERTDKRMTHWQQIAISACEQCGRTTVPLINAPQPVADWVKTIQADLKLILHPSTQSLTEHPKPTSMALLIGPEGGFTDREIEHAQTQGFTPVSFGRRILRTETAPVVALSIVQQLWGDF